MIFLEIKPILFEPNFFSLIAKENEEYLSFENLAQYEYNLTEGSFEISMASWLNSKTIDIGRIKYRINEKFTKAIHTYWKDLDEKQKKGEIKNEVIEFIQEAQAIKATCLTNEYLKFTKPVTDLLDRAIKHFDKMGNTNVESNTKPNKDASTVMEPIIWKANISVLCSLLQELTVLKVPNTAKSCLSASPLQLVKFIKENFVDENGEPFSDSTLKTYIYPSQKKPSSKNRLKISFE